MGNDAWAEAWSRLISALEYAYEIGMTEEEILDAMENAKPSDTPYVSGGPKRKKAPK